VSFAAEPALGEVAIAVPQGQVRLGAGAAGHETERRLRRDAAVEVELESDGRPRERQAVEQRGDRATMDRSRKAVEVPGKRDLTTGSGDGDRIERLLDGHAP
jgi:hypothetical protein